MIGEVLTKRWSDLQLAVFDDVANGTGHTVVRARAGSGKTSTICEAINYIPKMHLPNTLLVAFSKDVVKELTTRITAKSIKICTLHSMGYRILQQKYGSVKLNGDLAADRLTMIVEDDATWDSKMFKHVMRLNGLAKSSLADTEEELSDLAEEYEMTCEISDDELAMVVKYTKKLLDASKVVDQSFPQCDFDDMIWLPCVLGISGKKYSRVLVDETQDLSKSQLTLILMHVSKDGRVMAVGDDRQAIYRFRGAGDGSVEYIRSTLNAKVLPLSVSYRCSRSVINEARRIVPDIDFAPNATEGSVSYMEKRLVSQLVKDGDFLISRTNAPLIDMANKIVSGGKLRVKILGKDLAARICNYIRDSKAKDCLKLIEYANTNCEKTVSKMVQKDPGIRQDKLDKVKDWRDMMIKIAERSSSIDDMMKYVKMVYDNTIPDDKCVTLSTVHKAKGLERDNVFILKDTFFRFKGSTDTMSEDNIYYVAVTRARKNLSVAYDHLVTVLNDYTVPLSDKEYKKIIDRFGRNCPEVYTYVSTRSSKPVFDSKMGKISDDSIEFFGSKKDEDDG